MSSPVALNPAELPPLTGVISHGLAIPDLGLIYTSGQVAWDAKGELVGRDDLAAQFTKAYENIDIVLAAGGSSRSKIIKETIHLVGYNTDNAEQLIGLIMRLPGTGADAAREYVRGCGDALRGGLSGRDRGGRDPVSPSFCR